jgi:hypothetical protein
MKNSKLLLATLSLLLTACLEVEKAQPTFSRLLVERGDVVVVSFNTDSLVVFNSAGDFKSVLYQLTLAADTISGIAWLADTNEVLVSIDGTPDRVEAVSVLTGQARTFYANTTFLTGTISGITQLKNSSDVLVSEGATIERFSANGVRETWAGAWPSSVHANSIQLFALSTGSWLSCTTAAGVRVFPDSTSVFAAAATVTGPAGALASNGCAELADGSILVGWSGAAADYLYKYTAGLTAPVALIDNVQSTLTDPRGIAVSETDDIYLVDGTANKVIRMDASGNILRQFGTSVLNAPRHILVVPAFTP